MNMLDRTKLSLDDWFESFARDEESRERFVTGARTILNSSTAMETLAEMERNVVLEMVSPDSRDETRLLDLHAQLTALRTFREALHIIVSTEEFEQKQNDFLRRTVSH